MFVCILASEKYSACNLIFLTMSLTRKSHFILLPSCLESDFGSYALLCCACQLSANLWHFVFRHLLSGLSYSFTPTHDELLQEFLHIPLVTLILMTETHFLRLLLFTHLRKYSVFSQRVKMIVMFQNSNYFWYIPRT